MANLSNINNKFLVTTGGNVLIGATADVATVRLHVKNPGAAAVLRLTGGNDSWDFDTDYTAHKLLIKSNGAAGTVMTLLGASGYVGIGDTSPQGKLEVNNRDTATGAALFIKGGEDDLSPIAGQYTGLAFGYGAADIYNNAAILWEFTAQNATGKLHFAVNPTSGDGTANLSDSKMTILDSGNVGIGVTGPGEKLEIDGNIRIYNSSNAPYIDFTESGTVTDSKARITMDQIDGSNGQLIFSTEGSGTLTNRMTIDSSGRVGIGVTPLTWSTGVGKVVDVLQLNGNGALFTRADHTYLSQNFYYNSADAGAVVDSGQASIIELGAGDIGFLGTTTGASSGATVSVVERMRISSGGTTAIFKDAVETNFDALAFLRLHPNATTTDSFTNIFAGVSTSNNYGVSFGGLRTSGGAAPAFSVRTHVDSIIGAEKFRVSHDGDVVISGGGRILSSAGIYLGTNNNSNLLDYYEEGNWTPVIAHNDGTGVVPLNVASARYVRVGELVYVAAYLTAINPNGNAGGSGAYYGIRGFPFLPENYGAWQIVYASTGITAYGGYSGTASLYFMSNGTNGQRSQVHVNGAGVNAWGSSLTLMMNCVYNING